MLAPIEIDPTTFLREHCTLPSLPEVVYELQETVLSQSADINRVTQLIKSDPALVAQVLKVANSAYYGLPQEVSDVKYAIAFLGFNEIYRMALSLSVINTIAITQKEELHDFWFHSFYTALCTKYLATKYKTHVPFEEFWAPAILHDIGKLVYLKFFPDHYRALKAYSREQGCLFSDAEKYFALPASAYLGTILCDHWRLPQMIRKACECHTFYDLSIKGTDTHLKPFDQMIIMGNLCALISRNKLSSQTKQELEKAVINVLGCSEDNFLLLMGDILDLEIQTQSFLENFG